MGIILYVYRSPIQDDCTNGGVSSRYSSLMAVNVDGPFDESDFAPMLLQSHYPGCLRLVPAMKDKDGNWGPEPGHWMAGGNYASTSDSRFSEACERLTGHPFYGAVAVHDRKE